MRTPLPMLRSRTRAAYCRLCIARRDERGDVPGWVMITVMTIVVATVILGIFQPWVKSYLKDTLNSVG